jgi:hypothetical protein
MNKGDLAKLTFEDVAYALRVSKGEKWEVVKVVGIVQNKPVSQRRGILFPKKKAATSIARKNNRRARRGGIR